MSFGDGNLRERVARLEDANGWLCGEVNALTAENDDLRECVSDLWERASFTMSHDNRKSWVERLESLGIEVG